MSGISKRVSGSWVSGNYGIMKTATDTITTLPADIYANDTTATVGLKGNMEQNGTPTPTTPIQPSECGDRTANLFDTILPLTNIDGSGKIIDDNQFDLWVAQVTAGEVYTASAVNGCYAFYASKPSAGSISIDGSRIISYSQITFTVPNGANYIAVRYNKNTTNKMCNIGQTLLPYEPYGQYKIPISSASTTTPVYLGEVETTRQIKKLVLTGEENLNYSAESYGYCYTLINSTTFPINNSFCSHFKNSGYTGSSRSTSRESLGNEEFICVRTSTNIYFRYDSVSDANEFKAYLAQQYANGTPVTIWYVLATEETDIVNEPLMKIGEYADEVSGVTIPTIAGANAVDVLTTLKPSEVTVNYKGWHPVADVHERENGAWTE